MKSFRFLAVVSGLALATFASKPAHADLVTYFNFNDNDFVSDVPVNGPVPKQTSTIVTNNWGCLINMFGFNVGNEKNALGTDAHGGSALSYLINDRDKASFTYFQFAVDLSRYCDPVLSYARAQVEDNPIEIFTLSYSVDGGNTFTGFANDTFPRNPTMPGPPDYEISTFNLSHENALDGAADVIFRFSYNPSGGVHPSTFNAFQFDNIQLNATPLAPSDRRHSKHH